MHRSRPPATSSRPRLRLAGRARRSHAHDLRDRCRLRHQHHCYTVWYGLLQSPHGSRRTRLSRRWTARGLVETLPQPVLPGAGCKRSAKMHRREMLDTDTSRLLRATACQGATLGSSFARYPGSCKHRVTQLRRSALQGTPACRTTRRYGFAIQGYAAQGDTHAKHRHPAGSKASFQGSASAIRPSAATTQVQGTAPGIRLFRQPGGHTYCGT